MDRTGARRESREESEVDSRGSSGSEALAESVAHELGKQEIKAFNLAVAT
jgi:hypothetical protein